MPNTPSVCCTVFLTAFGEVSVVVLNSARESVASGGRKQTDRIVRYREKSYTTSWTRFCIVSDSETTGKGVALGVAVGLALGVGVGVAIDNIGLGIGVGMALGAALGLGWDQQEA
jgi:hypothetical protein